MAKAYWYKLYDGNTRKNYIIDGGVPEPIKLYPETREILDSFHEPTNPEGWNRLGMDEMFDTLEDAEAFFYKNEALCIDAILKAGRITVMKDMTDRIKAVGEAKKEAETKAHNEKVSRIEQYIDYINAHGEDFDILINNANAAIDAGLKLNIYSDSQYDFERGNFYANGIRHRLGFIRSRCDNNGKVVGLAVIGGGCNGDVSVVYKNGEVFYDTDKYYDHSKAFQALHPLSTMNDVLLSHYEHAFKTFANDIDEFFKKFEERLFDILEFFGD